jgi:hypothetical protein
MKLFKKAKIISFVTEALLGLMSCLRLAFEKSIIIVKYRILDFLTMEKLKESTASF